MLEKRSSDPLPRRLDLDALCASETLAYVALVLCPKSRNEAVYPIPIRENVPARAVATPRSATRPGLAQHVAFDICNKAGLVQ
jgi:hypothetical protein